VLYGRYSGNEITVSGETFVIERIARNTEG
jgi:hypothetical protein